MIGSFILGTPLGSFADSAKPTVPPKVEESSPEQDKAALQDASSDADKWAASHKAKPETPKPAAVAPEPASPSPAAAKPSSQSSSPAPAVTPPAAPKSPIQPTNPPPRRSSLNEMKGKVLSISDDPKTLRLIVDGGFNVEFPYDSKTSVVNGGDRIKVDDLGYNDVLIVRYSGKDLYAVEIERVSKAPRPE